MSVHVVVGGCEWVCLTVSLRHYLVTFMSQYQILYMIFYLRVQVAYHSFNVQSDGEDEREREAMVASGDGGEEGDEEEGQMHSEEV